VAIRQLVESPSNERNYGGYSHNFLRKFYDQCEYRIFSIAQVKSLFSQQDGFKRKNDRKLFLRGVANANPNA